MIHSKEFTQALDKVTIELIESLDYGEEKDLNDTYVISRHTEEDFISIVFKEDWEEVAAVSIDEHELIYYDMLYDDNELADLEAGRYGEAMDSQGQGVECWSCKETNTHNLEKFGFCVHCLQSLE